MTYLNICIGLINAAKLPKVVFIPRIHALFVCVFTQINMFIIIIIIIIITCTYC